MIGLVGLMLFAERDGGKGLPEEGLRGKEADVGVMGVIGVIGEQGS